MSDTPSIIDGMVSVIVAVARLVGSIDFVIAIVLYASISVAPIPYPYPMPTWERLLLGIMSFVFVGCSFLIFAFIWEKNL